MRKQLADTEKGIENMLNAIQAGILNESTKRRLDELEETKRKLELSIIQEEIKKPTYSYEQIMFYIMSFRNIDTNTLEGRRSLIDRFVNSVVVYDDEILINLNYKGSTKRVSFQEIEAACAGLDLSSLLRPKASSNRCFFFFDTESRRGLIRRLCLLYAVCFSVNYPMITEKMLLKIRVKPPIFQLRQS